MNILDLIMPGMGGKRCMEELLRKNPVFKIVIASRYTGGDTRGIFLVMGAKGFVSKPYDMKNLLKIIRDVLDA